MSSESPRETILQASAVPFRRRGRQLEFCLITSITRGQWGFPKGIIDPGDTLIETAINEAHEEAGLEGRILEGPLGTYEYSKWGAILQVTVLLMEVTACHDHWDEESARQRCWLPYDEALARLPKRKLQTLLEAAHRRITSTSGSCR